MKIPNGTTMHQMQTAVRYCAAHPESERRSARDLCNKLIKDDERSLPQWSSTKQWCELLALPNREFLQPKLWLERVAMDMTDELLDRQGEDATVDDFVDDGLYRASFIIHVSLIILQQEVDQDPEEGATAFERAFADGKMIRPGALFDKLLAKQEEIRQRDPERFRRLRKMVTDVEFVLTISAYDGLPAIYAGQTDRDRIIPDRSTWAWRARTGTMVHTVQEELENARTLMRRNREFNHDQELPVKLLFSAMKPIHPAHFARSNLTAEFHLRTGPHHVSPFLSDPYAEQILSSDTIPRLDRQVQALFEGAPLRLKRVDISYSLWHSSNSKILDTVARQIALEQLDEWPGMCWFEAFAIQYAKMTVRYRWPPAEGLGSPQDFAKEQAVHIREALEDWEAYSEDDQEIQIEMAISTLMPFFERSLGMTAPDILDCYRTIVRSRLSDHRSVTGIDTTAQFQMTIPHFMELALGNVLNLTRGAMGPNAGSVGGNPRALPAKFPDYLEILERHCDMQAILEAVRRQPQ